MMLSQIDDRQLSFHAYLERSEMTPEQVAAEQARVAEREKAIKKADGLLHRRIDAALFKRADRSLWLVLMTDFLALHKSRELRGGVKEHLLKALGECPHKDIKFRIENEFGIERPKARPGGPSPLRGKGAKAPKPPRHEIEARVQENRNNRKTSEKKAKKDK